MELIKIVKICGQPFRSAQPLFQYYLRKAAHTNHSSIFFSGDGADEIFGGYTQGFFYYIHDLIPYSSIREINNIFLEFSSLLGTTLHFSSLQDCIRYLYKRINLNQQPSYWFDTFKDYISPIYAHNLSDYQYRRLYDCPMTYWLFAEDCISLLNNVETRLPFLDQRICSLARTLNVSNLYSSGVNKYPLRSLFLDLPDHLLRKSAKYPRPSDTLSLVYSPAAAEHIENFLSSNFFKSVFSPDLSSSLLQHYTLHSDRKLSAYSDCWFRILTSSLFVDSINS
jgi:asparagine synthase (glutamine-hydrolysing)